MMLSFSDHELETIEMALRVVVEQTKAAVSDSGATQFMLLFLRGKLTRLIEQIEQYNEDQENGDA